MALPSFDELIPDGGTELPSFDELQPDNTEMSVNLDAPTGPLNLPENPTADAQRIADLSPRSPGAGFLQGLREFSQGAGQLAGEMGHQMGENPANRRLPPSMQIPNPITTQEELDQYNQEVMNQRAQWEEQFKDIPGAQFGRVMGKTAPFVAVPGPSLSGGVVPAAIKSGLYGAGIMSTQFAETPEDREKNILLGAGIGAALPVGIKLLTPLINLAKNPAIMREGPVLTQKIDDVIDASIKTKGASVGSITDDIRAQLHTDMKAAIKSGKMDQDVVRRLIDYRLTNTTPTRGPLSQDPGTITRQEHLRRLGMASEDPALQKLGQIKSENNAELIKQLNKIGVGDDALTSGQKTIETLDKLDKGVRKKTISPLYKAAEGTKGQSTKIDHIAFTDRAFKSVDEVGGAEYLPPAINRELDKIATGEKALTVKSAEQLKTRLFQMQQNLGRFGEDGFKKRAINSVRTALEDTPTAAGGKEAVAAFNAGRAANKKWMRVVGKTPALQAVREGIEPDKFMQDFIIGSTKNASFGAQKSLANVLKNDPPGQSVIRNYIMRHLKTKALSGSTDEMGKFSQSAFNRELSKIGDKKLALWFSPKEVDTLKAIGRVASYEQAQPIGSAVNNSNTATTLIASMLDKLGNVHLIRRIPLGAELVGNPARHMSQSIRAGETLKIPTTRAVRPTVKPRNSLAPGAVIPLSETRE